MDCGFAVVHLGKVALWRLLECVVEEKKAVVI